MDDCDPSALPVGYRILCGPIEDMPQWTHPGEAQQTAAGQQDSILELQDRVNELEEKLAEQQCAMSTQLNNHMALVTDLREWDKTIFAGDDAASLRVIAYILAKHGVIE